MFERRTGNTSFSRLRCQRAVRGRAFARRQVSSAASIPAARLGRRTAAVAAQRSTVTLSAPHTKSAKRSTGICDNVMRCCTASWSGKVARAATLSRPGRGPAPERWHPIGLFGLPNARVLAHGCLIHSSPAASEGSEGATGCESTSDTTLLGGMRGETEAPICGVPPCAPGCALCAVAAVSLPAAGQFPVAKYGKWNVRDFAFYWNSSLSLFSWCGLFACVPVLISAVIQKGMYFTVCAPPQWYGNNLSGFFVMLFIYLKVAELLDTVLLLLAKKPVIALLVAS